MIDLLLFVRKKNILTRSINNIIPETAIFKLVRFRDNIMKKVLVKPELDNETREKMTGMFREDILKLQDLIDRDLSRWLK